MAKSKNTRKLNTTQIVFYVLCALVILSMILAATAR
jgi:predicted nucleic acid-binding Zn ribbon protein